MRTKQGFELRNLAGLALVFLVVTIVISFGATIIKDLEDETLTSAGETIYNETITSLGNDSATQLTNCVGQVSSTWTPLYVQNATEAGFGTSGDLDGFGNNTDLLITPGGLISISSEIDAASWGNSTTLNVTYSCTYNSGDGDYNVTIKGADGLNTFADWLPTIALIVVAAVVIGIIVRYFAFGAA